MSTDTKKYTLKSSDQESFEVEESVAMMSQTLKNIIEDGCSDDGIPLPNVTSKILAMVIEYCKKHAEESSKTEGDSNVIIDANNSNGLKAWDSDFLKVDKDTLFSLILAANYLNIKDLLDLTCQAVADMIKNMSVEEVRNIFNIMNHDFTPEEEAQIRKENLWAFE